MSLTVEKTRIQGAGGFIEFGRVNGAHFLFRCCEYLTDDLYQAISHYRELWGTLNSRRITPWRLKNKSLQRTPM